MRQLALFRLWSSPNLYDCVRYHEQLCTMKKTAKLIINISSNDRISYVNYESIWDTFLYQYSKYESVIRGIKKYSLDFRVVFRTQFLLLNHEMYGRRSKFVALRIQDASRKILVYSTTQLIWLTDLYQRNDRILNRARKSDQSRLSTIAWHFQPD